MAISSKYLHYVLCSYYNVTMLRWCNLRGDAVIDFTPVQGCLKQHLKKDSALSPFRSEPEIRFWPSLEAEEFWWILRYT